MAAEEGEPQYRIVDLDTNKESNSSRDFTGRGRATYLNGDVYEGDYVNGLRTGKGIYWYKKGGHRYEGNWKENEKHGVGTMEFRKKGVYFGRVLS